MENNIHEHKENHNIIEYNGPDGYEEISEFDEKGRCVYFKNNTGCEYKKEYGERWVRFKYADGFEKFIEYDENHNIIHYQNSMGVDTYN